MDGKPRELHTELAAKALDFKVVDEYRTIYTEESDRANQFIDSDFFDVRVMEISDIFHRNLIKYDSFIITMCIKNDCKIKIRQTGDEIILKEGHSCFIPAAIADYDVVPLQSKSVLLDAFIDNKDRSLGRQISRLLHITKK